MKLKIVLIFTSLSLFINSIHADYKFGFGDVSVNYLDWDTQTEDKSTKEDFTFVEIEGFGQFSWGEVYGFFDIENFGVAEQDLRTANKGVLRYYLGKSNWSLFLQQYTFMSHGFGEQNRVVGIGYQLGSEKWWFKPFIGLHDVVQTYYTGANGYMLGWIAGYNFQLARQSFTLSNWHETELKRNQDYADGNGGKTTSQNGAVSLFWNIKPEVAVALQWRYAVDKLGTDGAQSALIYTVKYNF